MIKLSLYLHDMITAMDNGHGVWWNYYITCMFQNVLTYSWLNNNPKYFLTVSLF